ncbi:hypothetical protein LCGC14_0738720 [marine sediment metagenome]|uniref:Uncharacterized protein n=1 Tax=marine sediment metagenome TaxID=412755 RepID=A0A0F9QSF5_9ZZZZ
MGVKRIVIAIILGIGFYLLLGWIFEDDEARLVELEEIESNGYIYEGTSEVSSSLFNTLSADLSESLLSFKLEPSKIEDGKVTLTYYFKSSRYYDGLEKRFFKNSDKTTWVGRLFANIVPIVGSLSLMTLIIAQGGRREKRTEE